MVNKYKQVTATRNSPAKGEQRPLTSVIKQIEIK
jgi:hypothetical protein